VRKTGLFAIVSAGFAIWSKQNSKCIFATQIVRGQNQVLKTLEWTYATCLTEYLFSLKRIIFYDGENISYLLSLEIFKDERRIFKLMVLSYYYCFFKISTDTPHYLTWRQLKQYTPRFVSQASSTISGASACSWLLLLLWSGAAYAKLAAGSGPLNMFRFRYSWR
jgi:hypothetical protein